MSKLYELNVGDKFNFKGSEYILLKLNKVNAKIKKTENLEEGPTYNLNVNAFVELTTSVKTAGYGDYSKATTKTVALPKFGAGSLVRLTPTAVAKSKKLNANTNYDILRVNAEKYTLTEINGGGIATVSAPFGTVFGIDVKDL